MHRAAEAAHFASFGPCVARPHRPHLPPAYPQYRLQGRQHRRFLRALGRPARIRRHARCRQHHDGEGGAAPRARHAGRPALGILQSLVVGLPSTSAFARLFQFGMRLGMRSYTIGSAWWQGDCGPYWGHNAIMRLAPFIAHCELPALPGERARARPCAQPRPDRGGADAARRLAGARAGGGRRELRAEPADPDRVHPPRSALVPGQHAVLAFPRPGRPQADQPLPARCSRS